MSLVTRRCYPVVGRNFYRWYFSRLKGYKFEIWANLRQLGWIDAPHTQNFEILKSLEQTQESKNVISVLIFFCKILDGLNYGRRCLLRCFILKIMKFTCKMVKNLSKSVWVKARELKFCMNWNNILRFGLFWNSLWVLLKNSEIYTVEKIIEIYIV
jgi:hypothetical protein